MASPRKLLIEGPTEQRVITSLAAKHGLKIDLGGKQYLIEMASRDGKDALFDPEYLGTQASSSELQTLGIVLDANGDPVARLAQLRKACRRGLEREIPAELPEEGLILEATSAQPRFGVWLMPDNRSRGMLENFLAFLVPDSARDLWTWVQDLPAEARRRGATYKDDHIDKACMHAFLAFQDEPGRQLHEAINKRLLDPDQAVAQHFMAWLRRLFEV